MRKNQSINSRERALLAVEKNKRLALGFWNSELKSIQGKKGGKVGGYVVAPLNKKLHGKK